MPIITLSTPRLASVLAACTLVACTLPGCGASSAPATAPNDPSNERTPPSDVQAPVVSDHTSPQPAESEPESVGEVLWRPFHVPLAPLGDCTSGADGAPPLDPGKDPQVLTTEAEFVRLFCAPSEIDWSRHRLVIWVQRRNSPNTTVQGVTLEQEKLLVHWKRSYRCHGADYGDELWASAVVIPKSPELVDSEVREDTRPDCSRVP